MFTASANLYVKPAHSSDLATCLVTMAGSFLAMLVSYTGAAGLMFAVVRSTDKAWDYAVTVSCVHFVLCCLGRPKSCCPDF